MIKIHVAIKAEKGKFGCAVLLNSAMGGLRREISYVITGGTANQAALHAVLTGIMAIADGARSLPVAIHSGSRYVSDMLARDEKTGKYSSNPQTNVQEIEALRAAHLSINSPRVSAFNDMEVTCKRCLELARVALSSPSINDSGTFEYDSSVRATGS